MIRILIVDDHPVVRHGIAAIFRYEADIEVVGDAADGQEAIDRILLYRPDVVLLDLRLPRVNGVEVMRHVHTRAPEVRFLILTTYDNDIYITPALGAGAKGYLLKDATPDELVRAVKTAMQGGVTLEPGVAARLMQWVNEPNRDELSSREIAVLELLVSGASNKLIATKLHVSENTIKTHISHIFSKLGVQSRAEAVAAALQRGIVSIEPM